jgi:hypothetical protein
MKAAALLVQERKLEVKHRAVQEQRRKLIIGSSGLSVSNPDRHDLTFDIDLAEYLAVFAGKPAIPTPHQYESVIERGVKHYMKYPPQFVGTLPTKPPTHVWAEAHTVAVWAKGDPKPLPEAVPIEKAA